MKIYKITEATQPCVSCDGERAEGSMMCAECLSTASRCNSCGVALVDHMGHQQLCAELQKAKAMIDELTNQLRATHTGSLGTDPCKVN